MLHIENKGKMLDFKEDLQIHKMIKSDNVIYKAECSSGLNFIFHVESLESEVSIFYCVECARSTPLHCR